MHLHIFFPHVRLHPSGGSQVGPCDAEIQTVSSCAQGADRKNASVGPGAFVGWLVGWFVALLVGFVGIFQNNKIFEEDSFLLSRCVSFSKISPAVWGKGNFIPFFWFGERVCGRQIMATKPQVGQKWWFSKAIETFRFRNYSFTNLSYSRMVNSCFFVASMIYPRSRCRVFFNAKADSVDLYAQFLVERFSKVGLSRVFGHTES